MSVKQVLTQIGTKQQGQQPGLGAQGGAAGGARPQAQQGAEAGGASHVVQQVPPPADPQQQLPQQQPGAAPQAQPAGAGAPQGVVAQGLGVQLTKEQFVDLIAQHLPAGPTRGTVEADIRRAANWNEAMNALNRYRREEIQDFVVACGAEVTAFEKRRMRKDELLEKLHEDRGSSW